MYQHAPLNASAECGLAVIREIDTGTATQELKNRGHRGRVCRRKRCFNRTGSVGVREVGNAGEFSRHLPGRKYIVNTARSYGAVRHAVVFRGLIVLGEGNATLG